MNIISCCKLLPILIMQAIHVSEQTKHIFGLSSIDGCKGKNVDLIWKVDEENNKISKLEWYFKNKMICTSSPVEAFTVEPSYQDRIERINKTEIRLKSVSRDDEGVYILFPLYAWSTSQNMQNITLRVLEPPTNKCTCNISHPPDFTSEQTASYCGRPRVSCVWGKKQAFEVLGEGSYTLNSTLQDKEVLWCQNGEATKCVDDRRQLCTTVSLPHQDDERPSEDGNTQHTDSAKLPGTNAEPINTHDMYPFLLVNLIFCILTITSVLLMIIYKIRKKLKDGEIIHSIMCLFHSTSSSDRSAFRHPPEINDPGHETKAIAVNQHMDDSEANSEVKPLQPSTSCKI